MDNIFVQIAIMVVAIVAVVKGGDIFVDAASWMAEATGIPKLIVGATVVSIATTLPEMLVSAIAAWNGSGDMAICNAVGSVTANIGLIMALSLICIPAAVNRKDYLLKSLLMIGAGLVIVIAGFAGSLDIKFCLILLIICAVSWTDNIKKAISSVKASHIDSAEGTVVKEKIEGKLFVINIVKFVVGAAAIAVGANYMVSSGQYIAGDIGIPEGVIGATIIAVGTSLPELITTITAIRKKEMSLSVGNIIGANILDLTLILPVCALITNIKESKGLMFTNTVAGLDLPFSLIVGAIAVVPMLITKKFSRWQGVALMITYLCYVLLKSIPQLQALLPWLAS